MEEWHYFEDAYIGEFPDLTAYAEQIVEDLDWRSRIDEHVPEGLKSYVRIDAEQMAEGLRMGGEIYFVESDAGIYVFNGHI